MYRESLTGLIGLMLLAAPVLCAGEQKTSAKATDRNKVETRDDKQMSDREMEAAIRRSIGEDKTLSTYSHNVKIIVLDGKVTLRGPVHNVNEMRSIGEKATEIVGMGKVTNDLSVKGANHQEGPLPEIPPRKKT